MDPEGGPGRSCPASFKKRGQPNGRPLCMIDAEVSGAYFMVAPEAAFCILTSTFSVRFS